jgi:aerobic-type carbon monoxide dehydrogenase small subunit (CoxS/CutS family)
MTGKVEVTLTVNGRKFKRMVQPRYLLADFLRHEAGLKGTHIGCEHGVCGACTVLIDGATARSCLHFAVAVQSSEITTVEALSEDDELNALQSAFHENHGLQCGFCTSGFLMTATELLKSCANPSEAEIREALTNNICRCTGYSNIVKSVVAAVEKMKARVSAEKETNHG